MLMKYVLSSSIFFFFGKSNLSIKAHYGEQNWKETFWGTNYPRLSALKTKYDPNMVFWASPGINADFMEVRQGRLCKLAIAGAVSRIAPKTDNTNAPRFANVGINSPGFGAGAQGKERMWSLASLRELIECNDDPFNAFLIVMLLDSPIPAS